MTEEYIKLRNEAVRDFQETGSLHKIKRLYKAYNLDIPDDNVLIRGIQEAIKEGKECITK